MPARRRRKRRRKDCHSAEERPFCSRLPDLISQDLSKPSNSEQAAASSWSSSVMVSRSPARMLSTPAASGVGTPPTSRKWINRPRLSGITASSTKRRTSTSKVTSVPTWLNGAPSKSKPTAVAGQVSGAASHRNRASSSIKRRISQALARRSTHGRRRVAHAGRERRLCPAGSVRPPPTAARSAIAAD